MKYMMTGWAGGSPLALLMACKVKCMYVRIRLIGRRYYYTSLPHIIMMTALQIINFYSLTYYGVVTTVVARRS